MVEDDATVLALLEQVLRTEGYQVLGSRCAIEAVSHFRERLPDLALVDICLGGDMDGLDVVRHIRESADVPIVIVSGATDPDDIEAGFATGADMYIEKPFAVDKLLARIAGLLGRTRRTSPRRWRFSDLTIDTESRTITRGGQAIELPKREFDLLCALARTPGRILTKSQLLAEVWGYVEYDENVVERRISSLRQRLEAHGPRLIRTVRGCGYKIQG